MKTNNSVFEITNEWDKPETVAKLTVVPVPEINDESIDYHEDKCIAIWIKHNDKPPLHMSLTYPQAKVLAAVLIDIVK